MSFPEYGKKVSATGEKEEFAEYGKKVEMPSRFRSLVSAPLKGILKGAQEIVKSATLFPTSPFNAKMSERLTEELLPTQEKLPEQLLERGGKLATYAVGGEGSLASKALRTGVGALAGQTVKEVGGGQLAQDIAELASFSAPDLAKHIPAKKAQERVINFLRQKGWTEREITPLLQNPKKLARFAKFSSKGEKLEKLNKDIYNKFDNLYEDVRDSGKNLPSLNNEQVDNFLGNFQEIWEKIPAKYRRKLQEDVNDLFNSEMKFTDFMDFNQAVNSEIRGEKGGKAILGKVKEATKKSQREISPELTDELSLVDKLYGTRANFAEKMRPNQLTDLMQAGEIYGLAAGIADGNFGMIKKVLGLTGARKLSREILINPRLQNISQKMLQAFKENKVPQAMKLYEIFKKESKSIPDDINASKND